MFFFLHVFLQRNHITGTDSMKLCVHCFNKLSKTNKGGFNENNQGVLITIITNDRDMQQLN